MSRNSAVNGLHFGPCVPCACPYIGRMDPFDPHPLSRSDSALGLLVRQDVNSVTGQRTGWQLVVLAWLLLALVMALAPSLSAAASDGGGALQAHVEGLLKQQPLPQGGEPSAADRKPWRVEVTLGQLDPRLKLAPCDKIKAYVPDGAQLWGRSRVGLRCEQGVVRWNVYWPVTVKVWGQALVAAVPLKPGNTVSQADVVQAEVDLAAHGSPALTRASDIVGRTVVKAIAAGQSLRQDDVKARRWFAAGDPVRVKVKGPGFMASAEAVALAPGDEGRCARLRTETGRVLCAVPVGERLAEITL